MCIASSIVLQLVWHPAPAKHPSSTPWLRSYCQGLLKLVLYVTGATAVSASTSRSLSSSGKQNTSAQNDAAVAVATSTFRRSQRQLQQRQVREQQELDKIQHNVNINAIVSNTITLLASPAVPAERRRRESSVSESVDHAGLATDLNAGDEEFNCSGSACQQLPQQQQQQIGKASKPGHGTASRGNKGLVHSPKGVKKQTSPVGKSIARGSSLGARFPLRVRKNLEHSQVKQGLQDKQGHQLRNRGLADSTRPVVS